MDETSDRPTIVLGAGGHAKVIISTLQACGIAVTAAFDNDPELLGNDVLGVPVVGPIESINVAQQPRAVIAVGNPQVRQRIAESLNVEWITVVHPLAYVHPTVTLGQGTVVFAGAIIQPDTSVGVHGIINTGATVDHDCRLGDYVNISPGCHLAGAVTIGDGTVLGIGSSVIPCINIGSGSTIGAGATVVRNIPDDVVAVGCPARVLRHVERE